MTGTIGQDDAFLNEVSTIFKTVIDDLEKIKISGGAYPSSNDAFWEKFPITNEYWLVHHGIEFSYSKSEESTGLSEEERNSWGGYELRIHNIRYFWNLVTGFESTRYYCYRPSHYYPKRMNQEPIKKVGNWALIYAHRLGPVEDNSNPDSK